MQLYDVAVIGLGPVGATFANLLACRGLRVAVLEREPNPYALPRAVHFDAECMRVFDAIGVAEQLKLASRSSPGMKFINAEGKLLVDWPRPQGVGPQGWCSSYRFHQPELETTLREAMADRPEIDVRLRCEALSVEEEADGAAVRYKDLSSGALQTLRARYVVGADGARSMVRRIIGDEMRDLGLHERWLVFDVLLKRPWTGLGDHSVQFCDPERPATYVRGVGDRRRWEIMLHPDEDAAEIVRPERVWHLLSKWITPDDADLERAVVYTFHALVAKRWRRGRLFLIGDSAHQTPPFLGQGMCAGIRDAANLAWKLDFVIRHGASSDLLESYQAERDSHASQYIELAVELGNLIQARNPEEVAQRDHRLASAPRQLQSLSPRLGDSDVRGTGSVSGFISHQPILESGERLDRAAGQNFVVLARQGFANAQDWASIRNVFAAPLVIVEDGSRETTQWLDELGVRAVVIRPDRYMACSANSVDVLHTEMARLRKAIHLEATAPVD